MMKSYKSWASRHSVGSRLQKFGLATDEGALALRSRGLLNLCRCVREARPPCAASSGAARAGPGPGPPLGCAVGEDTGRAVREALKERRGAEVGAGSDLLLGARGLTPLPSLTRQRFPALAAGLLAPGSGAKGGGGASCQLVPRGRGGGGRRRPAVPRGPLHRALHGAGGDRAGGPGHTPISVARAWELREQSRCPGDKGCTEGGGNSLRPETKTGASDTAWTKPQTREQRILLS